MKAVVLKPCSINSVPAKAGDVVDVCAATFANLVRKGLLAAENEIQPAKETVKTPKSKTL